MLSCSRPNHSRTPVRRVARGAAALLALVLVASNALAAMGLCIAKAPALAVVTQSAQLPCPQHDAGVVPSPDPAPAAHCPQDDPGAQVRAADVPAADVAIAPVYLRLTLATDDDGPGLGVAREESPPPTPLYTRLSRLLL